MQLKRLLALSSGLGIPPFLISPISTLSLRWWDFHLGFTIE
jgi:hypothetical protein